MNKSNFADLNKRFDFTNKTSVLNLKKMHACTPTLELITVFSLNIQTNSLCALSKEEFLK
jgi:hypothetical protein